MNATKLETLVGAIVVLAALGFFIFAAKASGFGGGMGGYRVSAQFDNVDGVAVATNASALYAANTNPPEDGGVPAR